MSVVALIEFYFKLIIRITVTEEPQVLYLNKRILSDFFQNENCCRHSHRMVVSAMSDLFGVKMSLGTVNRLRREGSEAVSEPVEEAKAYIQSAPIVGADETGFGQGNTDGNNPQNKRAWLWVAVTPLVSFFQVMLSRSTAAAQYLLGESRERDSQQ